MKKNVLIFDTTLRDGEQSPGCSMDIEQKIRMAHQLERLGVDIIEAGFPIASDGDFRAVQAVAQAIKSSSVAALCRAKFPDIECAWEAIKDADNPRIHTFIATSKLHMEYKQRMTPGQVLKAITECVSFAKQFTENVEFSAEDASRSDLDFIVEVTKVAIQAGATTVNLPDTVGYATPSEYGRMFAEVRRQLPDSRRIHLSAHTHNDLGLAVANSLSAIENGADQVECTINGIGERAGNAALEEIVMALNTRPNIYKAKTNLNTQQLITTSQLLTEITGVTVQPNKAIVGKNAFAHEAGIHQHGVLNNTLTYEIITPESVGAAGNQLVIGKHSGRHALHFRCRNLGYSLSDDELENVYKQAIHLADAKKEILDDDLRTIVAGMKSEFKNGYSPNTI